MQLLLQLLGRSGTQPVEDVVVPLVVALHANPGLLQQVVRDEPAHHRVLRTGVAVSEARTARSETFRFSARVTFSLKWISTNFPKRLLLLFLTVFAFPKASRRGLAEEQDRERPFIATLAPHTAQE